MVAALLMKNQNRTHQKNRINQMFNIQTATAHSKTVIKSFVTFTEARYHAEHTMKAEFFELDHDYADCADFMAHGQCYCIEPSGFKVAA
jgi:hypothetical protein